MQFTSQTVTVQNQIASQAVFEIEKTFYWQIHSVWKVFCILQWSMMINVVDYFWRTVIFNCFEKDDSLLPIEYQLISNKLHQNKRKLINHVTQQHLQIVLLKLLITLLCKSSKNRYFWLQADKGAFSERTDTEHILGFF